MSAENIIITGHAGGLGSCLFSAFTDAGYHVIGIDRTANEERSNEIRFELTTLSDPRQRDHLYAEISEQLNGMPLKALINNAATQHTSPVHEVTCEMMLECFTTNTLAPLLLYQMLRDLLIAGQATIFNIGSVHAHLTKKGFSPYATSKAALSNISRAISLEEGQRIRTIEIRPGATATDMLEAGFTGRPDDRKMLDEYQPTGKIAEPEEVADLCVALMKVGGMALNGSIMNIDGGISAALHDPA